MRDDFEDRNSKVGYRKPPKKGQFKKGVSGNPSGRPKKVFDWDGGVVRELESLLTINENGQRKSIKKFEAITKQLVHKAISGSLSAIRLLIELRRDARERAAEMNERSPYDPLRPGTYSARDLTDDQLAEIILRGERKRSARKGSKRRKARQSRVIDK